MTKKINSHSTLSADPLFGDIHAEFRKVLDSRHNNRKISLADALMSGFAMFSLKEPSLLAFDERRKRENENLRTIYGMENIPSDTQMREILDEVDPKSLRPTFTTVFRKLQRNKILEQFVYFEGHYLLSLDGTGTFASEKINSDSCLEKKNRAGVTTYYQQMFGAAIVHPDIREVVPLPPEMIIKQDGQTKNDCERNAAKRFLKKFRKEHPHLKVAVVEDSLSSNAPHILELRKHNCAFILGVKPKGHSFLFNHVDDAYKKGEVTELELVDENNSKITHRFRFLNNVPLNESNQDLHVNFLEYWQEEPGTKTVHFSWVTNFTITTENCYKLMRAGRARWKIENETFNTLKNQGYNLEHNYGLGKKHLSVVFVMLMMLAFLVDQTQQLCCPLFRAAWEKEKSKRALWEHMRSLFRCFNFESMETLYEAIVYGYKCNAPDILKDT